LCGLFDFGRVVFFLHGRALPELSLKNKRLYSAYAARRRVPREQTTEDRMKKPITALCLLALISTPLGAAPQAVVDAVQAPAWVERDGRQQPAAVGMEVRGSDRIRTGKDSRIYLKLADGSTVKLGENGVLLLESLGGQELSKGKRLFTAALDVLQGAFRFTTDKLARPVGRDVKIRVSTVTAGIRGTDIWGRTEPERDFVCLLEGRINVGHKDGDTREMSEPMTFYLAPRNQPPQGIAPVDPEQVRKWAAETEIKGGDGATRRGGKWKVLLASAGSQQEALDAYDKARGAGFAASIRPRAKEGVTTYEVLLRDLPSKAEAQALAGKAKAVLGLEAAPTL
jgi:hypothetical protein